MLDNQSIYRGELYNITLRHIRAIANNQWKKRGKLIIWRFSLRKRFKLPKRYDIKVLNPDYSNKLRWTKATASFYIIKCTAYFGGFNTCLFLCGRCSNKVMYCLVLFNLCFFFLLMLQFFINIVFFILCIGTHSNCSSFNDVGNIYISNASSKHEGLYICIAENNGGVAEQVTYIKIFGK